MALERIDGVSGGQLTLTEPCFCKTSDGRVMWTNGKMYTRDGTAPGRVEVFLLLKGHGIITSFEWASQLDLATPEEVLRFKRRIEIYLEEELAAAHRQYETTVQSLKKEMATWRERSRGR